MTPLRFAITSPPSGCEGDSHPQAVIHARRTKKAGLPWKAGPFWSGLLRSSLEGSGCWYRLGLFLGLRRHLGSELLLNLEGDGVGVHFVSRSSVAEDLSAVVARGGQHDGQFNQDAAQ